MTQNTARLPRTARHWQQTGAVYGCAVGGSKSAGTSKPQHHFILEKHFHLTASFQEPGSTCSSPQRLNLILSFTSEKKIKIKKIYIF